MYSFHFSTRFEQPSARHQENQLYQYIIWYISLCVFDRLVCGSGTGIPGSHKNYTEMHGQRNIKFCASRISRLLHISPNSRLIFALSTSSSTFHIKPLHSFLHFTLHNSTNTLRHFLNLKLKIIRVTL
jgi:hypothetical protein